VFSIAFGVMQGVTVGDANEKSAARIKLDVIA
jgi:hypothetical protein